MAEKLYRVKALEWMGDRGTRSKCGRYLIETVFEKFFASAWADNTLAFVGSFETKEQAKAACQAHRDASLPIEEVKVAGEIPWTADRFIAGVGCELWANFPMTGMENVPAQCLGPMFPCVPLNCLYGDRKNAEAALAAQQKETNA